MLLPACLPVETESKPPTLIHVIPADGRVVAGLTFINNNLFVLRYPSKEIQMYETATFRLQRTLRVAGLRFDRAWYKALASCEVNFCLYICDHCKVYKVELSDDNNITNWRVDSSPTGLSVNSASHVLVTCDLGNEIREYTTRGELVRAIRLHSLVTEPKHVVQLTDSLFIVTHWGPVYGVSLVDERGRISASYRNSESTRLLNAPRHAIARSGSVLVADCGNNRIVVLDTSLNCTCDLDLPIDGGLVGPLCFHVNSQGRLFVGEAEGKRVLIFDNIHVSTR